MSVEKYITCRIDGKKKNVYKKVGDPLYCYVEKFGRWQVTLVNISDQLQTFQVSPQEFKEFYRAVIKRKAKKKRKVGYGNRSQKDN